MESISSKEKVSLSVVVPFYNEEDNVLELYRRLKEVLDQIGIEYELVFVDDGSNDTTGVILHDLCQKDGRIVLIKLRRNFGQTAALAAGFDHADGDYIISMDGDLQHDPSEIPRFLEKMEEGYDIVSGWRKKRVDNLLFRRIPSWVANRLMAILSGLPLHDFGTTYNAYRREVIQNIELFGEMHRFVPALATELGVSVIEIPISNVKRRVGRSKYGLGRTFGVFLDLLLVKFVISYMARPLRLFGFLGIGTFLSGFFISASLMLAWLVGLIRAVADHGALLLFSVFLMLIGLLFVVLGIMAEVSTRIYHRVSGKRIYTVQKIYTSGSSANQRKLA